MIKDIAAIDCNQSISIDKAIGLLTKYKEEGATTVSLTGELPNKYILVTKVFTWEEANAERIKQLEEELKSLKNLKQFK